MRVGFGYSAAYSGIDDAHTETGDEVLDKEADNGVDKLVGVISPVLKKCIVVCIMDKIREG